KVYIELRERDHDSGFVEFFVDLLVQGADFPQTVFQVSQETTDREEQGTVTEFGEEDSGCRVPEYGRMPVDHIFQYLHCLFHISAVIHAHFQGDAVVDVGQGPVQQPAGDELLVWHQQFLAIPVADGGGANLDACDSALALANGNHIPHTNRS